MMLLQQEVLDPQRVITLHRLHMCNPNAREWELSKGLWDCACVLQQGSKGHLNLPFLKIQRYTA